MSEIINITKSAEEYLAKLIKDKNGTLNGSKLNAKSIPNKKQVACT